MVFENPLKIPDVGMFVHDCTSGCGLSFCIGIFIGCIVAEIFYEHGRICFSVFDDGVDRKSQRGKTLVGLSVKWA